MQSTKVVFERFKNWIGKKCTGWKILVRLGKYQVNFQPQLNRKLLSYTKRIQFNKIQKIKIKNSSIQKRKHPNPTLTSQQHRRLISHHYFENRKFAPNRKHRTRSTAIIYGNVWFIPRFIAVAVSDRNEGRWVAGLTRGIIKLFFYLHSLVAYGFPFGGHKLSSWCMSWCCVLVRGGAVPKLAISGFCEFEEFCEWFLRGWMFCFGVGCFHVIWNWGSLVFWMKFNYCIWSMSDHVLIEILTILNSYFYVIIIIYNLHRF